MSAPYWASDDEDVVLHLGDCLDVLRTMEAGSVDAIVTDPPAGIAFMDREWDDFRRARNPADAGRDNVFGRTSARGPEYGRRDRRAFVDMLTERLAEAYRVLKPGGHALVWAIPRTSHWTAWAIEDAGFDLRDCVLHLFGSGFPKSRDVSKDIDRMAGAEREVVGAGRWAGRESSADLGVMNDDAWQGGAARTETAPATEEAARWSGWGTALKPGQEMWWLARKPLKGTVAGNVLEFGTGALNIDGCRVDSPVLDSERRTSVSGVGCNNGIYGDKGWTREVEIDRGERHNPDGRWPANIVFTHSQCAWYALRHDISEDIRQAVLAYYRSTEGVREVRDGLLRDAIRASKTPLLFSGLRECGAAGRPGEAVGAGDVPAVRRDVRDLSGLGAQRSSQVLFGEVPGAGGGSQGTEPDGQAAHRRLAGQDGHEPGDQGAIFPVEGRPVPERGRLLVRDGRPAIAGDAGASPSDDQGPVYPGASDSSRSGHRAPGHQGRGGPSRQRGEDGQPAGEPDRDHKGEPLAGAPRDREEVRDADGRGGDSPGGECVFAVPVDLIPPGWLSYFEYLHSAACDGQCAPDCPVGELDRQSGVLTSGGDRGATSRYRLMAHYSDRDRVTRYSRDADTGGASRFYPTFRYQAKAPASERPRLEDGTAHETVKSLGLMTWMVKLITPPGGTVLDMFAGSGPVGEVCVIEGFRCVLIEQNPKSAELIKTRLAKPIQPAMFGLEAS